MATVLQGLKAEGDINEEIGFHLELRVITNECEVDHDQLYHVEAVFQVHSHNLDLILAQYHNMIKLYTDNGCQFTPIDNLDEDSKQYTEAE